MKDFRVRVALALLASTFFVGCRSTPIEERPTYQLTPAQLDDRLSHHQAFQPVLNERVIEIARTNLKQPYDIYLLGEAPFEMIDPQPVYNLRKSDCVVFVEHTLAMAMSDDFSSFLRLLQRIRYRNGEIGVRTRNHYTEVDWNLNNQWLVREITNDIAGGSVKQYKATIDRKAFFKQRYKIDVDVPKEPTTQDYIPFESIAQVKSQLRTGDVVNFVKGTSDSSAWVHHMGFVAVMPNGEVHLIHSIKPQVREETIETFIANNTMNNAKNDAKGKARHRGFKFFRLTDDPMANLKQLDGVAAPKVSVPAESPIAFDAYVEQQLKLRR
jgi:hypothetical protein